MTSDEPASGPHGTYVAPEARSQEAIAADLSSDDVAMVQRALVDGASWLPGRWIEEQVRACIGDPRVEVRKTAVVALGILIRQGRVDDDLRAFLEAVQVRDPAVAGVAGDALDDLELFVERPPQPRRLRELIRAVGVLALPATVQAEMLQRQGLAPLVDELALAFADEVCLLEEYEQAGWLDETEVVAIRTVDGLLSAMTAAADPAHWQVDALEGSSWQEVRSVAATFFTLD